MPKILPKSKVSIEFPPRSVSGVGPYVECSEGVVDEVDVGHLVRLLAENEDDGCEHLKQFVKIDAVVNANHFVRCRFNICVAAKWLAG